MSKTDNKIRESIGHEQEHWDIHEALFGNPETGQLGIVQMNKEMYEAWSAIIWLGKGVTALAIFLAAVGGVWVSFGHTIMKILKTPIK